MIHLILVRHGETIWHKENRYAGCTDVPLNAQGQEQAQQLAAWAITAELTQLYVSPLCRARQTILPVEQVLGREAVVDSRLRELDFGNCEGLTSSEIASRFPEQYARFCVDPVRDFLPGGGDPLASIVRGGNARDDLAFEAAQRSIYGRVLVVSHNTLIRLLLCGSLGIAPARYRELFPQVGNVALTELGLQFGNARAMPLVSLLRFNSPLPKPQASTSTAQLIESRLT